jgi:hypothetical protein
MHVVALNARGVRVAAGLPDQALEELRKNGAALDMVFINVHEVLNAVRDAFYENDLLEVFVIGPGSNIPFFARHPGHTECQSWRESVARYRQQSIDRLKTRERVRQAVTKLKRTSKSTACGHPMVRCPCPFTETLFRRVFRAAKKEDVPVKIEVKDGTSTMTITSLDKPATAETNSNAWDIELDK